MWPHDYDYDVLVAIEMLQIEQFSCLWPQRSHMLNGKKYGFPPSDYHCPINVLAIKIGELARDY